MIAGTVKQLGGKKANVKEAAETAKFLSDAQSTLRNQSLSLSGRLEARELTRENGEFSAFQKEMTAAADAMSPAAQKLQQQKWQDAIPDEQKALQHLLRAEATFRRIEVAFGARGGGGGGSGAGRDLASLFDLELDTEKNQYETQQTASSSDQRAQDINDALRKLDELARRQEELAQRQRNNGAESFEQRWQQEMLQREAEQLQRQMEQLAQDRQQGGQGRASSGSGSSQGQSSSQSSQSGRSQSAGDERARSAQQAAQQALDRLRQAQDEMRRAASDSRSTADARLAAQRLREASDLLGGVQSQEATNRLGSMAREADRLTGEEKEQADRVKRLKERPSGSGQAAQATAQEVQQLAKDRQRMADDLSNIEQNMRNAARELDATQRAASDKLRAALEGMDQADLETRIQRTADWLRTGIDPTANGTEAQIASGLQRLSDQLHQAQQALVAGGQRQSTEGTEAALSSVDRLRRQIEALSGQRAGDRGQGQAQAQGRQDYQTGSLSRNGQPGEPGQQGAQGDEGSQARQGGNGQQGGRVGNNIGPGGAAGPGGYQYGGFDTGNNARSGTARAPSQTAPAGDPEQSIQQGLNELNQLRRQTSNDPEMQRQIQELISEMEHLDLRRFPGNPAMVEELHQRLLSGLDTLELQLRRDQDGKGTGQIRSTDPHAVPPGYEEAVADYFRRLSATGGRVRDK